METQEPGAEPNPIYHMLAAAAWALTPDLPYADASLAHEGFIHFSGDPETLLRVANAFYRGEPGDWLILEVNPRKLAAALKWESAGDGTFPHLFGPLNRDAVVRILPFPRRAGGGFELPDAWRA